LSSTGWKRVFGDHPYATIGFFIASIFFIAIAVFAVAGGLEGAERQLYLMFVGLSVIIVALAFGLVLGFERSELNTVERILAYLPKPEEHEITVISNPNEIWRQSIELIHTLVQTERAENKHAYDVTTYMNKILYEEAVAEALENGIVFNRIFCFNEDSKRHSDMAIQWFFDKIVEGVDIKHGQVLPFEDEIAKAFDGDSSHVSDGDFERLKAVLEKLHQAREHGKLEISQNHPQHTDFVVIKYTPRGSESEVHEVVANFKTHPTGATYTIGIRGRKRIALEYKNMFEGVLRS
jgi:hypothetical protein